MIGKVARFGSSFLGAMHYCYYETRSNHSLDRSRIRGELIYAQHLSVTTLTDDRLRTESKSRLNLEAMATTMQSMAALNERTRKPVWHQSFSFPIGECPPAQVMVGICQSFARTFGMENNPMVAFRHRDREHEHFHIVASRIDVTGKNTAKTSFNYREVAQFCRAMEDRHDLTPGPPTKRERQHQSSDVAVMHHHEKPLVQQSDERQPAVPKPLIRQNKVGV
ncbi:relaxase/mobilization nuclease family protein (plasmid) [Fibrella aestuarina BUZ 2]|uniref:Relaxase/mobilization nuclease family protein n=1 Tax=Fibrella aestuarina BUZ 2 TaxID=1166018 RepID=I0KHE1_9BACT|nr:relaxase/mobilization nuclease domain-containing protein [Fibrella aestuarina]CCH03544.1 relaxase/mobilization nuclease family protein [Fibrella aestuarina BUZ 2]